MSTRKMLCLLMIAAATPVFSTGCVQHDRYDDLLAANRSLEQQLIAMEEDRDTYRENLDTLRSQWSQDRQDMSSLETKYSSLRNENDTMSSSIDQLNDRVSNLRVSALPADVEMALSSLAMQYPQVMSFDSESGVVRFASDVTFDLGSTELKAQAKESAKALANILNGSAASNFEVQVIGHTDNVRIARPATRAKHPTNTHLSVHRAIAVRDVLVNAGVNPARIQVAGYGEYRPVTENGRRGAAPNRRVEIFLRPMHAPIAVTTMQPGIVETTESAAPVKPTPIIVEPMK